MHFYCSTRSLYSASLAGYLPRFLSKCLKNGSPVYCVLVTFAVSLVAYLNVNEDGMVVFNWFVNLCATGLLLAYICMWWSYFQFRRAWEAQHKTKMRNPEYPYFTGPKWLHPVLTYLGMTFTILVVFFNGFWIFFLEILMYLICLQVTLPQLSLFAYFYFWKIYKNQV